MNSIKKLIKTGLLSSAIVISTTLPSTAGDCKDMSFTVTFYADASVQHWNPAIAGINDAAKQLGVNVDIQFDDSKPEKQNDIIQTAIANGVDGISGGQAQAVAIARTVYFKSKVLLLDESTSALSVRETEWVLNYVRKLKSEGTSSVLVTHNLYHAYQGCDRFIVMSHGKKSIEIHKEDTTIQELTEHVIKV